MSTDYRARLALTSLALALTALTASTPTPPPRPCTGLTANGGGAANLYSRRALLRVRTLLQMRLFELRKARLERVERAIERNLPSPKRE